MRAPLELPPLLKFGGDVTAKRAFLPLWLAVAATVTVIGVMLFSLLYLSAQTVDRISFAREKSLVELVIAQSVKEVPHNQESVTVWDDAIVQLRRDTHDLEWLDNNLGVWLHAYFGLDEAYVLNPEGRAIYAMRDGER
jgi:sensor domain CHASE-containing protein